MEIGLDIGTSTVKAITKDRRIIFPSVYGKRLVKSVWDARSKEVQGEVIEGIGHKALDIARYEDAILIHPVLEGQVRHEAAVKLVQEVFRRFDVKDPGDVTLVSGLPYDVSLKDVERIEKLLVENLGEPRELAIYPAGYGTLIELGVDSATSINIGHSTTGLLLVENLSVLGGGTEPKGADYVVAQVKNFIVEHFGISPHADVVRDLVVSREVKVNDAIICKKIDSIFDAKTVVTRKEIDPALASAVDFLTDKIAHDILEMHIQLPVRNLGCVQNIVVSGGFSKLQNPYTKEYLLKDSLERKLKRSVVLPEDALFSEASGFHKLATELSVGR